MSKNLTRKGLAFGAVVALGSTLIAGSPAFAADELVFAANTGTALAAPVTEALTLNASLVSSVPAGNIAQLKFKLETDGTFVAKAVVTTGGGAVTKFTKTDAASTAVGTGTYVGAATSLVVVPSVPTTSAANTIAVSVDAIADATTATTGVAPSATTTTRTVNVTAWIDADLDGVVDAAEFQKMQTVTFRKYSEITATTAITAPVEGDTTATAAVKFDNINNEQLTPANVGVFFTKGDGTSLEAPLAHTALAWTGSVTTGTTTHDFAVGEVVTIAGAIPAGYNQTAVAVASIGTTATYTTANATTLGASTTLGTVQRVSGARTLKTTATWSATKFFKFTTGAFAALAKTDAVKVQPLLKGTAIAAADYSTAAVGTAATASVTARAISTFKAGTVRSATAAEGTYDVAGSADVALNSSFQVSATAKNTTTAPAKAVVGSAVTAKIEVAGVTLSSTKTVTVNGVTYSDATKLPGYNSDAVAKISAGSTDANGAVTLSITTVGFAAGNDVIVTFYAENFNAAVTANAADSVFSAYLTNAVDAVSTTDGVAAKLDFVVRDQFGNKPANATYEISTDGFANGQTTAGTSASQGYTAVVDGAASLSILDNGTGTGVNTYDIYLGKRASNGTLALTQIRNDFRVQIVAAADLVAGTILEATASLDAVTGVYTETVTGTAAALALADFVAYDSRSAVVAGPDAITPAVGSTIAGTVTTKASATAAAVAVDGAAVTITGAGLQFVASIAAVDGNSDGDYSDSSDVAAQKVFGIGSLTVYTDNSGAYSFTVYSNKSGKQTVTLTSGAATRTVIISTFAVAGPTTGTSLVLTAPATILPGRTLEVSGLLTDEYGNSVAVPLANVSIAYNGPGLVVGDLPKIFDVDGSFKFRVLLGANDSGSAIVTVKYDQGADADFTGTTGADIDLVKTATITIGAAAVVAPTSGAVIASKNGRVYVTVNSPAGFKSYVKVGFSVKPAFTTTGSKLVSYFVGSGKRVAVVVFVRGGKVASQAITIK